MEHLAYEIGLVIISSALIGVLLYFFKQPLILAYILAGVLIGPFGFNLIQDPDFINGIAKVGIILMLFLVGLEMKTSRLKDLGLVSLIAGVGQVLFTGIIGFFLIKIFGFSTIQSIYLAIALCFSSTVIAVKLLSDKKDTHSFHGQICIGILIVQDILAIFALLFLTGFHEGSLDFDIPAFLKMLTTGILLGIMAILISKKILKYLYSKIATSHELLILFSLSWCFLISLVAKEIGFSLEIGSFIAGISLANLPYAFEINIKAKVLRDFFITMFFVALGTGMVFTSIREIFIPLIVLSLFVLVGNPLIILLIMKLLGYNKRIAFFTGLNIANISEFSLIVIALGGKLGHLSEKITSMTAIIAMITMVISSYMITHNNALYRACHKYLFLFGFKNNSKNKEKKKNLANHIILLGCGHMGQEILEQVLAFKEDYIVIDQDNEVIKKLINANINCIFGDIEDEELLEEINIEESELIISTLPNSKDHYFLLKYLKKIPPEKRPIFIATAYSGREGLEMFNRGVDYVILRPYLSAQSIHAINRELYNISKDTKHVKVFKKKKNEEFLSDSEIGKILRNLNKIRLQEIKEKVRKR